MPSNLPPGQREHEFDIMQNETISIVLFAVLLFLTLGVSKSGAGMH
jgi:hypothetical protein